MWVIRALGGLVVRCALAVTLGIGIGALLALLSTLSFVTSCRWAFVGLGVFVLSMAAAPGASLDGRVSGDRWWGFGGGGPLSGGPEPAADRSRINPTAQLIVIGAVLVCLAAFL